MSERETQRDVEDVSEFAADDISDIGVEGVGVSDDQPARSEEAAAGQGFRSRLTRGAGSVLSPRGLIISLVLVVSGLVLVGGALPLGTIGNLLGIFVGAFIYGLATDARRYLELAVAGAIAGGGWALLSNVVVTLLGAGIPILAVGTVGGALAGIAGHYFGRDLRDGLTREI